MIRTMAAGFGATRSARSLARNSDMSRSNRRLRPPPYVIVAHPRTWGVIRKLKEQPTGSNKPLVADPPSSDARGRYPGTAKTAGRRSHAPGPEPRR
jgi:hypothetical protein